MDKQKIKVDLILTTGTNFFAKFVGYIIITILVRYLTKDEMGAFFFAATLATFFALISTLGTNQYLIREVSEKPEGSLLISRRFSRCASCFRSFSCLS